MIPSDTVLRAPIVPGSMTVPGGSSAVGASLAGVTGAWEIPAPALSAYQRAAQIIGASDTRCHLPWELLAAIGRVESDHGRYGGSSLDANGLSVPKIFGPELDGRGGRQVVADTDGGTVDSDPGHDRAVGPMQFLPATWSAVKVDADSDGTRNPQDIDDAALAAAVYLCSGPEDLASEVGQRTALLRYNGSASYGLVVLRVMQEYTTNTYSAAPSGSYAGAFLASAMTRHDGPEVPKADPAAPAGDPAPPGNGPKKPTTPTKPAPPASEPAKAGVPSLLHGIAADPGGAVPQVLTTAQATVVCVAEGVSALDLRALSACITDLVSK